MNKRHAYLLASAAFVLGLLANAANIDKAAAQAAIDFTKEPVNVTNYGTEENENPCEQGGECSGNGGEGDVGTGPGGAGMGDNGGDRGGDGE